jgi:hypothetical protein
MKRFALILALLAGPVLAATEDDLAAARESAQEVAGAWSSNGGFKTRDGYWSASLKSGEAKVIQVNLYAGNQYWFTAAGSKKARKIAVTVYDESGKPVATEMYEDGARAAAGFTPAASGPYLVKVQVVEGDPCAVVLVYSYK